jgi:hypothetical protein
MRLIQAQMAGLAQQIGPAPFADMQSCSYAPGGSERPLAAAALAFDEDFLARFDRPANLLHAQPHCPVQPFRLTLHWKSLQLDGGCARNYYMELLFCI